MFNPKPPKCFLSLGYIILILAFQFTFLNGYAQIKKGFKKNKKADKLYQRAIVLADSAKYDSAVLFLNQALERYNKSSDYEKIVLCKNEIVKQSRNLKFNDELLVQASKNIKFAQKFLGVNHSLTASSVSLLGNIYADINQHDSAIYYFVKAKQIWERNPGKNYLKTANASINIGQMLRETGDMNNAIEHIHAGLKILLDSIGHKNETVAKAYNSLGVTYYHSGNIDSCAFYFVKALEVREKVFGPLHPAVANAFNNAGVAYKIKGDYDKTLEYYFKALKIRMQHYKKPHPNLALSYSNIGVVYAELGEYQLAKDYYQKALDMRLKLFGPKHLDVAACYTNLGILSMDCGEGGNAIKYTSKAFEIIIDTYGQDNPNSSNAFNNMGAAYVYGIGDLDKALVYFEKGLELRRKTDPENFLLSSSYNNVGAVYKNRGDYELALSYYKAGLEIFTRQNIVKHEGVATSCNNIGEAYLLMGKYDLALEYLNRCAEIRKEIFGEKNVDLANVYTNIGATYGSIGNLQLEREYHKKGLKVMVDNFGEKNLQTVKFYNNLAANDLENNSFLSARKLLNKSLAILRVTCPANHPDFGSTYLQLAKVFLKTNNYDSAEHYLHLSIDANTLNQITEKPNYNYILDEITYLDALAELANLYFTRFNQENKLEYLKKAVAVYGHVDEMVNFLVAGYHVEASKLALLSKASEIYPKALLAAKMLYDKEKNTEHFLTALGFSESNKSTVLYRAIAKSQSMKFDVKDSLRLEYYNLAGRIGFLKQKVLDAEISDSVRRKLDYELSLKLIEFQHINNEIARSLTERQIVSFDKAIPINELQQMLTEKEVLLEYFLADSLLYCFVVGKNESDIVINTVDKEFSNEVLAYVTAIRKHRFNEFVQKSYYLYKLLVKPVEKYILTKKRLIIIPDDNLLYMPFSSLIQNSIKLDDFSKGFTKLPYLINSYEIVQHNSVNLYLQTRGIKDQAISGFLGVAPFCSDSSISVSNPNLRFIDNSLSESLLRGILDENNSLLPLPYSEKEVTDIMQLFEGDMFDKNGLLGKNATEQAFKALAKNYKYIHIATHGIINDKHPELSGLAFFSEKKNSNADGVLFIDEIYNLQLAADLVVLSACETGIGKLSKGEGVLSLTRGFLYNNVSNLVYSLWKIDDKSTYVLMTSFYKSLLKGNSYSRALQLAQLSLIANEATAFPANWAAFSLIGR